MHVYGLEHCLDSEGLRWTSAALILEIGPLTLLGVVGIATAMAAHGSTRLRVYRYMGRDWVSSENSFTSRKGPTYIADEHRSRLPWSTEGGLQHV